MKLCKDSFCVWMYESEFWMKCSCRLQFSEISFPSVWFLKRILFQRQNKSPPPTSTCKTFNLLLFVCVSLWEQHILDLQKQKDSAVCLLVCCIGLCPENWVKPSYRSKDCLFVITYFVSFSIAFTDTFNLPLLYFCSIIDVLVECTVFISSVI